MPRNPILVFRQGDDWCVRSEGALFERMSRAGDAIRVARAHAERAGQGAEVRVRTDRRPR